MSKAKALDLKTESFYRRTWGDLTTARPEGPPDKERDARQPRDRHGTTMGRSIRPVLGVRFAAVALTTRGRKASAQKSANVETVKKHQKI